MRTIYRTRIGVKESILWITKEGNIIDRNELRYEVNANHKELDGKPLLEQIEGLGLRKSFDEGTTPVQLPVSL